MEEADLHILWFFWFQLIENASNKPGGWLRRPLIPGAQKGILSLQRHCRWLPLWALLSVSASGTYWRITHERLSMTSCCFHSALPQPSAALLACYWGFNEIQGEHTWLPGMPHSLHFSTTIKCPHFKVTFFQLVRQHPETAEHGGVCGGVYWQVILAQRNQLKNHQIHCNCGAETK